MLFQKEYNSDGEEVEEVRKHRKPRRKKRICGLGGSVVVIKNVDKDVGGWMESWDKPKTRNPGHIPHPFRLLALGGVGRGKTNSLKNIFLKHQSSSKKFQRLIVCTCDTDSQEWDDCDPDLVLDTLPDLEEFDGSEKTCLVIDDFEFAKMSKAEQKTLSTLFRFISSHRNVSIMCSYQSFFDCPSIARKCANCFLIYKPNSRLECSNIENRVGMEHGSLRDLFADRCSGVYDSVMVDKTIGTPYPLRKNIYEVLDGEEYGMF